MENLNKYLLTAINASVDAGLAIMEIYRLPLEELGIEDKPDQSPLTLADKASNEVIMAALANTPFPVLSEEGADVPWETRSKWSKFWLVDPLDGTKEFIKKNGEFTVNIALVDKGEPVAGVVYIPDRDILYFGITGTGSFRVSEASSNSAGSIEQLIGTSSTLPVFAETTKYRVVVSRSHMDAKTEKYIAELENQGLEVETVASGSSIKICLVAEGSADEYPRFGPTMEWDTAAGHAVARAAGVELTDPASGLPLRYNKKDLLNPFFLAVRKNDKVDNER